MRKGEKTGDGPSVRGFLSKNRLAAGCRRGTFQGFRAKRGVICLESEKGRKRPDLS
jgi:hypothetical protein